MPVMVYRPLSVRVQDYINAWLAAYHPSLFIINPVTKRAIVDHLHDMPIIGFSTKIRHPMGFIHPKQTVDEFEIEAVLSLELDPKTLPKDLVTVEGDFWLFELTDDSLLSIIQSLADDLFAFFGLNIIIMPNQVHDDDPKHLEPQAVSAALPGVVYCPVLPKREI